MGRQDAPGPEAVESSLAEFVAATEFSDLPDGAVETVRRAFVDTVGVTLAGTVAESGDAMRAAFGGGAGTEGGGAESDPLPTTTASLAGDGEDASTEAPSRSVADAALAYGTAAHALDYDDLSWAMDGHPSVVLVPPILALAEGRRVSGEGATTAYAVGYEVACAVAEPVSPGHYEAGWHATATFGAFGATAAAASLLDLSPEETETALNVAASTPAGTKRNFGSMTKPLHAGLASRSGVTAALLAAEGFTSGTDAIAGDGGFWDLYGEDGPAVDDATSRARDGDEWTIETHGIHTKRYPCCYFTHAAIAAVQRLAVDHDLAGDDVVRVDVYASGGAVDALSYSRPETELEAKFSMPHAVAVGLTREVVGLQAFEPPTLADDAVAGLYDRVTLHRDESLPYDSHAARVELDLGDRTVAATQEHPPWVHSAPPTDEELREKFVSCATRAVSEARAERLYERVSSLPDGDVGRLLVDR